MMLPEYYPDAQVPEAGTRDATVDPSLPTPQLLSPLSGSVMSTRSPTITWRYASGAPESTIDICTDRACTTVLQTQTLPSGTTSYPVANVPAGHRVLFFRVFSASAMGLGPSSPVWQLRLPKIDANPAAVSTALRTDADFDGDGLADIAYDVSDGMTRVLRIAFGSHVRPPAMLEIQPPMGMDIPVIGSPAVVGDVNGDGFVDLAVKTGTGVVLFRGNAIRSQILTQPTVITGSVAPEFGNSIAGVGDVSTDGYADIVLGEWIPMSRRALSGFLVQGSATGSLVATNFVTGQAGARVPSEFGRGISAGDCNGDHVNEVAISDPVFNFSQLGNITLYHPLGSMGMVETVTEMTMSGVTAGVPRFGTDVTLRGDNNGDGLSDVLASAPNGQNIEPNGTSGYGALLWAGSPVNGATRAMIPLLKGGDSGTRGLPEQRVAETIAQVGDVNGDGLGDIAMSSRTVAPQGSSVFIFRGIRGGSPMVGLTLMGQSPTAAIGSVIGGIGDFDGDGFDDVAIPTTEASPAASGLKLYYGGMMFLEASPAVISAGTIGGVAAQ